MKLLIIVALAMLVAGPLTAWGFRFARRHRGVAFAATSLLLMFGLNLKVDPPPPPRLEAVEREDEKAGEDEPK